MSRHKNRKNGVPDRWLDYTAVGKRIPGTRFIAFKVPLKQALTRQLPRSQAFGPWELLDCVREEEEELGLIIDLTYTSRYYTPQDVPSSVLCVKILTAGHEIPADETILSFKRAVRSFLRHNAHNDKLIGVHCTHGLNRTGYLLCRYLIDVDGMDPKAAVKLFNSSRGHNIERQNYLDDLKSGPRRSNDGMEESEQEPVRGSADRRPDNHNHNPNPNPHRFDRHPPIHGHPAPPYPPGGSWRRPPRPIPPEEVHWPPPPRTHYHHRPPPPMQHHASHRARQEDGRRGPGRGTQGRGAQGWGAQGRGAERRGPERPAAERRGTRPHISQYRWGREDDDHWT